MSDEAIARAGSLLRVERGEYSAYEVIGFFVVLKNFDPMAELKRYLEMNPKQAKSCCFESNAFLAWLIAAGLLLEIEASVLDLGGYGDADNVSFRPSARDED
jgi:hypothetical protein